MKRILSCAALGAVLLQAACGAHAADDGATAALQALAVRIKQASDATAAPRQAPVDAAGLERELHAFDAAVAAEPALARKYGAVALLFGKLQYQLAHPAAGSGAAARPQAARDRQTPSAQHGMSCAVALGIAPGLPVEIALSAAGGSGSDAWFRIEPAVGAHYVFTTDSNGADPALAIFSGCGTGAPLAQDDDTIGLDAQASVAAADRTPLLVHVTNSGGSGAVRLSVAAADATISGRVLEAGTNQPLQNVAITLYDQNGNFAFNGSVNTDVYGNYSMPTTSGQFYVRAVGNQHVTTVYPNAVCAVSYYYGYSLQNCPLAQATLVTATSGVVTQNVNFALGVGQRIAGTVRDQANQPLGNITLGLADGNGNGLTSTTSDAFGRYQFATLPNGTYKVTAGNSYNNSAYSVQMYNHVTCGGPLLSQCDLSQATPLTVAGRDLLAIDFNLQQLANIHGSVSGPSSYATTIRVLNQGGGSVAATNTDSQGHYFAGPLPVGQYYVYASSNGYFSRLYPNVDCGVDCSANLASGTAFTITQQGQSEQADFTLTPLPVQHGHVQDAISAAPLQGVQIAVSMTPPATFSNAGGATTDANGNFSFTAPGAGSYYVWAQSTDHVDQVYSGVPCEGPTYYYYNAGVHCDVTGSTLMTVSPSNPTLPDMNFALQPSSQITGHVYVRASGGETIPASNVSVGVYDSSGLQVDSTNVDALGAYVLGDLAPGTYFVQAASSYYYSNYVGQVWQNIDCPNNCVPTQGTPVVVGANATVSAVDFSLVRRDAIIGRVTDASNAPIAGVLIDLFDATSLAYVGTTATDAQGNYLIAANMGSAYFVATEAPGGYVNQIYSGVGCPLGPAYQKQCAFTNATSVGLTYGGLQPHEVDFTLSLPPDEIFAGHFE